MSVHTSVSNRWSSHFAYVLAATGAAVGLGNIWKFPYIMGENGGGAFVLVYLLCILLIGIPVMMAEVMLGKRGRSTPANAVAKVAQESGASKAWGLIGASGVFAGFAILSFYVVIAGWALAYVDYAAVGKFADAATQAAGDSAKHAEIIGGIFGGLVSNANELLFWSTLLVIGTVTVLAFGVKSGLERAATMLMPALFVLLLIIMGYSAIEGDFGAAAKFMFEPDFDKLTIDGVLVALGHAFFTLSLSSGIMIMYGAYLPEGTSIIRTSMWIAALDTIVALVAGLAIYPIVFGTGMEPAAGPGLLFKTLPIAFGTMPGGYIFSILFFVMVVFAAFTSAIALLESATAYLVERRGFKRGVAAVTSGVVLWVMSLLTIYSFGGAEWAQLNWSDKIASIFDLLDYATSNVMLPLTGLAVAVFTAWIVRDDILRSELQLSEGLYKAFKYSLGIIAPIAIAFVFAKSIGLISF